MDYLTFISAMLLLLTGAFLAGQPSSVKKPPSLPNALALFPAGMAVAASWEFLFCHQVAPGWERAGAAFFEGTAAASIVWCLVPKRYRTAGGFLIPMALLLGVHAGWVTAVVGTLGLPVLVRRGLGGGPWKWVAVLGLVAWAWVPRPISIYDLQANLLPLDQNGVRILWMATGSLLGLVGAWRIFHQAQVDHVPVDRARLYSRREGGILLVLLGVLLGGWPVADRVSRFADDVRRVDLANEAGLAAAALGEGLAGSLKGSDEDLAAPTYIELKRRLAALAQAGSGYRFAYVMVEREGKVLFLADSEPVGSKDESAAGDVYKDAPAQVSQAFLHPEAFPHGFTHGPYEDQWGVWVSGLAPIRGGKEMLLLGLDRSARHWNLELARLRQGVMGGALLMMLLAAGSFMINLFSLRSDAALMASAEEARRSREEARRLALVAERTSNAVVITDTDGRIEWVNTGFERITGYSLDMVRGRSPGSVLQKQDVDAEADRRMREAISTRQPFSETVINHTRSGQPYWVAIECQPLLGEDGTCTGFMAIEQEVTGRLEAERAIAAQRNRLKLINDTLAALGDHWQTNLETLTRLGLEIFEGTSAFYLRVDGSRVQASGVGGDSTEESGIGYLCYDIIRQEELFYYVENALGIESIHEPGRLPDVEVFAYVDQEFAVAGDTIGTLGVVFPDDQKKGSSDLRECLLIIAQAIGREELLEEGRQRLDRSVIEANAQRSRLSTLLENIDDAVLVEDEDRHTSFANAAFLGMFDIDREEIGRAGTRPLVELLADTFQQADAFCDSAQLAVKNGKPVGSQTYRTFDGRYLSREFFSIRDGEKLHGYLWRFRDITRQYQYEKNLEALAQTGNLLLRTPLESAEAWGSLVDLVGGMTNSSGTLAYRFSPAPKPASELVGRWVRPGTTLVAVMDALATHLEWLPELHGSSVTTFAADHPAILEACGLPKAPAISVVKLEVAGKPWGALAFVGRHTRTSWLADEISLQETVAGQVSSRLELQDAYRELLLAKNAADAANRAKSGFLAAMSHEIRTPLNAVIGMASLLERTPLNDEQREQAATIGSSAKLLLHLVSDVLDYSKIEADRLEIETLPFALRPVLEECVEMIRPAAIGKGIELVLQIGAPPAMLVGDSARLRQILLNLLSNAVKFTSAGQVRLEAGCYGTELHLAVVDTGIGISSEVMAGLFTPFVQADSSTTRRFGGTGLGLAISQRLAYLMGGRIEVESDPGKGSKFRLVIPCVEPATLPVSRDLPLAVADSPPMLEGPLRVLVVEDHPTNQRVMRLMLKRLGTPAELAVNGLEACAKVEASAFDLIFMDVQMDEMDGLTATRRIREWEIAHGKPRTPVVALTANAFSEDRAACLAAGMDDFLAKPVTLDHLRVMLDRCRERGLPERGRPRSSGA